MESYQASDHEENDEPTNENVLSSTLQTEKVKKPSKRKLVIGACALLFLVGFVLLLLLFIIPNAAYQKGVNAFENEDYSLAEASFLKAGDFKDANKQAGISKRANEYSLGIDCLSNENFSEAIAHFQNAEDQFDAVSKLAAAENGLHCQTGDSYFLNGQFSKAASEYLIGNSSDKIIECIVSSIQNGVPEQMVDFCDSSISESNRQVFPYCQILHAAVFAKENNFSSAIEILTAPGLRNNKEAVKLLDSLYLPYAEQLEEAKKYSEAETFYGKAGDTDSIIRMRFLQAESVYKEGKLNTAKALYEKLPEDYSFNDVSVSGRLETLNKFEKFVNLCGKYQAESGRIETRETWNSGYYYYWYNEYSYPSLYITVTCKINDNGKVTVSGSADYFTYTNYSSNSNNLNIATKTCSFSKASTSVPSTILNDSNRSITYSGGAFNLRIRTVDSSNISYNITYTNEFKFKNKILSL